MFEKLENYCKEQLELMHKVDSYSAKRTMFDKCFGAFDFIHSITKDEDTQAELVNIWESWHTRLEVELYD